VKKNTLIHRWREGTCDSPSEMRMRSCKYLKSLIVSAMYGDWTVAKTHSHWTRFEVATMLQGLKSEFEASAK
jgi:hypothetical protein